MGEQIGYRFPSGMPPQPNGATSTYLPAGDAALDELDAFLTSHTDDVDADQAGHDLAVYLCDWVVANSDTAKWFLDAHRGMCCVELRTGDLLDAYRHVVQCVTGRRPVARRFAEQARKLGA